MNTLYNYGLTKIALSKEPGQSDFDYYTGRIQHDAKHSLYGIGGALLGGLVGASFGHGEKEIKAGALLGAVPGMLYSTYHSFRQPYDAVRAMNADIPAGLSKDKLRAATNAQNAALASLPLNSALPVPAGTGIAYYFGNKYNEA